MPKKAKSAPKAKSPAPQKTVMMYGREWPAFLTHVTVELVCLRQPPPQSPGPLFHFKRAVDLLWNHPDSRTPIEWTPWLERMIEAALEHKYLAVAGCASSGKSQAYALWAIIQFLSSPWNTLVLVTSTSLKESRKRIWGAITDLWRAVPGLPGKLVDSVGMIRFDDGSGKQYGDRCGISLIAAERKKEKEAVGKLVGIKQQRVIFIADELPELGESILQAAYTNLSNNPFFQLIGIGNPASYYDPFGQFSTPKNGWSSITVNDEEWETERGYCLHFDAHKSPNVIANEILYPWMITPANLAESAAKLGENSPGYWRMYRGFWCPTGVEDSIYSESDIIKYGADQRVEWLEPPTKVAALDPSFSANGDRSILYLGFTGADKTGKKVVCLDHFEELREDVTNKSEPRAFQIARQFKERCEAWGVTARNAAYDASGGGAPFGDVVDSVWSRDVLRVQFGGKASDRAVSLTDTTPAHERYANRVSELWYTGKELIRNKQLFGVPREMVREMTERLYTTEKGVAMRIRVESKQDMKARIGKSPDISDAAFILLELCRVRCGLIPSDKIPSDPYGKRSGYKDFFQKAGLVAKPGRNLNSLGRATFNLHR
jgi:hypothetical protein